MNKKLTLTFVILGILSAHSSVWADATSVAYFTKMRTEYAQREDFDPQWEDHDDRMKILDLWNDDKIDEGMKLARQWLEKHPIDAKMHLWYASFLRQKGDFQGCFRHKHLYQGLLASITSSGSGLSPDSPMKVISVSEEYTVLRALGAKLQAQALIHTEAGVMCDEMECGIEEQRVTLYFDVTVPMDHTMKMLTPDSTEEEEKEPPKDTENLGFTVITNDKPVRKVEEGEK